MVERMTDAPTSIQPVFNSQVEIERLLSGLTVSIGRLKTHIDDKDVDPRNCDEYKQVAEAYNSLTPNLSHLIELDLKAELPRDPKERYMRAVWLVQAAHEAGIGKIGQIMAI
jgi:hypothetical protein